MNYEEISVFTLSGEERRIKLPKNNVFQFGTRLSEIEVGLKLPDVVDLEQELDFYWNVLLGRIDVQIKDHLALMEYATAYYSRGMELDSLIHKGEREGVIEKGSPLYQFRTGELRAFIEMARRQCELGARRIDVSRRD